MIGLAASYLALTWAGNASVAAWNAFEYPYNDGINFLDVFRDMMTLPLGDVVSTGFSEFGLPYLNMIMFVSFVLAAVALLSDPIARGLLITASVIVIPFGLLGLMSLIGIERDGEWLAEGWAMLEAFAVWSVILWAVATARLVRPALSHQTAPAAI